MKGVLLLSICAAAAAAATVYKIDTAAGSSFLGDGGPAIQAQIGVIQGIAVDRHGNLYIADSDHHRVRKVDTNGTISTVAGTGIAGFSGDKSAAISAQLNLPYGIAVDGVDNLYIADLGNARVRRVTPAGIIDTYAGGGASSSAADGDFAKQTQLRTPRNLAVDAAGNLYVSEFEAHRVRKVTPDGRIATVAGTGVAGLRGDGGPASAAQLAYPAGLALDRAGNLYIADSQNQRIRKIGSSGTITTVLGAGTRTLLTPTGVAVDGAGTIYVSDKNGLHSSSVSAAWNDIAGFTAAGDLTVDASGNLWIADGMRLRRPDGQTVAGDAYQHFLGDGGAAATAILSMPSGVSGDGSGNLWIADTGTGRIRQVLPSGVIQSILGSFRSPAGVASNLIADTGNHRILKAANGTTTVVAGTGTAGIGPEGLPATQTALNGPGGLCFDSSGALLIVDTQNHRVLRLRAEGTLETAAGNGSPGSVGDNGPARLAELNRPSGCAADSVGDLFIADTANDRIRKVDQSGTITTLADHLSAPAGVAVDAAGNVFIADSGNHRICEVTPDGALHVIAGSGTAGFDGDDGPALDAHLHSPAGLFLDAAGALYFADSGNNRVRRLTPQNVLPTPVSVVNAASYVAGPVSPGEIVAIFGTDGSEVRFDGLAATILYAGSGQVNAQVPYALTGTNSHMEILSGGNTVASADLAVAAAAPGLFPIASSADAPVSRGSVIAVFGTGAGLTQPEDMVLSVAGIAAQVLYAGGAPGLPGVFQINAVVPGGFVAPGPATVRLSIGGTLSPPITVWLQ